MMTNVSPTTLMSRNGWVIEQVEQGLAVAHPGVRQEADEVDDREHPDGRGKGQEFPVHGQARAGACAEGLGHEDTNFVGVRPEARRMTSCSWFE